MARDYFALLVILGIAFIFLAAIAAYASRKNRRVSRAFRRDPLDWHPGRFFPPALIRPDRQAERPAHAGRKVA